MHNFDEHFNDIQMDGCQSSINKLDPSIWYFHIMVQIVYNIYFEIDEYHPIKGQLLFILLVYVGLLLGTHSMEAPSQQQPS